MEMRAAAEAYCEVIEAADGSDRSSFVSDVARTLAAAVAAAYRLPEVEWTSEIGADEPTDGITHEQWAGRFSVIKGVIGEWGEYWSASTAYRLDDTTRAPDLRKEFFDDPVELRFLADDLADVWRDLRDGLDALERGDPEDEVTWEWRSGFRTHWGAHAVEALRALHQQVAG